MAGESRLWERCQPRLKAFGHFCRIENRCQAGHPDVDYCIEGVAGKIELKHHPSWPMRASSKVFGKNGLREAQEVWFKLRLKAGGRRLWILAKINTEILLIPGIHAQDFNQATRAQLYAMATWRHDGNMQLADWGQLAWHLQWGPQ